MKGISILLRLKAIHGGTWLKVSALLVISLFIIALFLPIEIRDIFVFVLSNTLGLEVGLLLLNASRALYRRGSGLSLAWGLVGVGELLSISGNVIWMVYNQITGQENYTSPADFLFILTYVLFFIAGMVIPSKKIGRYDAIKTGIDIVVVMLSAVLVYWNFLLGPVVRSAAGKPLLDVILAVFYPVADLALFWVVLVVAYRISHFPGFNPHWLLLIALLSNIGLDTALSYQTLLYPNSDVSWVMTANLITFALMGVGAHLMDLQARDPDWVSPDKMIDQSTEEAPRTGLNPWIGYLPYLLVGVVYLLLVFFDRVSLPMTLFQLTVSVGAIIFLFLVRQGVTFGENQALYADLHASHQEVRNQARVLRMINQTMQVEISERRRAEERLSYDALHDSLTGLPNRVLLLDRIEQAKEKREHHPDEQYALLFLDLDRFKVVNDSLGHNAGDHLLVQVAQILSRTVRFTDTVARLGGDEFIILLEGITSHDDALVTADRIQVELSQPILLSETPVYVSASIGVVLNTGGYISAEELLRDADLAMYQAKARGKARYAIFDDEMRTLAITRLEMENDLRRAIEHQELLLYYQPVLSLTDQRLVGLEALCRWQHPRRGLLGSEAFIPMAEETGLILPLGQWVLWEACRQAADWYQRFPQTDQVKISVNVSARQLSQPDFVATVKQVLANTGLPGGCLVLEVTEAACMENLEIITQLFNELNRLGVEIQIDDFGTGYASLSYLKRLPIHTIKIDKTFIQPISLDGTSQDLVRGILTMVRDIGISSVAEGIENERQLEALHQLHCQFGQGFFLAHPMDRTGFEQWLSFPLHAGLTE